MDYTMRFGLEFNPFLKNAKEILIETKEAGEVRARLSYLLNTKGFGLLTGNPGCGKTTALRAFAASLNPSLYKVVYSSLSTLTAMEFYRNLSICLGLEPAFRKVDNCRNIQQEITRLSLEKKITAVIILDEANHISGSILSDLKILFNFEMDSKDRAVVILAGLPQLNHTLRLGIHESLRQRIVMNYNIELLSQEESKDYILSKLKGAGCTQPVFEDNALHAIINAAGGNPRMLNKLCNAAMLIADSRNLNLITSQTAMQSVNDSELG